MNRWRGIVLHHSATSDSVACETQKFREFHMEQRGWLDIGYHAVVERIGDDYEALMGRPWYMHGAHCPGKNLDHLGVCFAGNFHEQQMPEKQLIVGARLIASLCVMCDVGIDDISLHSDWRDTICPGELFPFDRLKFEVRTRL